MEIKMKIEDIERKKDGSTDVRIQITKKESDELRVALALVREYEKIAIQAFKNKYKYYPTDLRRNDWCNLTQNVKNDKTIVKIKEGYA